MARLKDILFATKSEHEENRPKFDLSTASPLTRALFAEKEEPKEEKPEGSEEKQEQQTPENEPNEEKPNEETSQQEEGQE